MHIGKVAAERMSDARIRILLADDHDLVREAISASLSADKDISVDVAADLASAMDAIGRAGPYDLVLLDYSMPGMDGLLGLGRALAANGGRAVAVISGTASREVAEKVLAAGAAGFVPKTISLRSMAVAAKFMAAGEVFAPFRFLQGETSSAENRIVLSERERQVLARLCEGKSNKEIARDCDVQEVTVKLHVKTLSRKLGARNRTHAAMIARDQQIL